MLGLFLASVGHLIEEQEMRKMGTRNSYIKGTGVILDSDSFQELILKTESYKKYKEDNSEEFDEDYSESDIVSEYLYDVFGYYEGREGISFKYIDIDSNYCFIGKIEFESKDYPKISFLDLNQKWDEVKMKSIKQKILDEVGIEFSIKTIKDYYINKTG